MIADRFGVEYHVDHIGRLLHGLGWSPKEPTRRAVERDEEEIKRWCQERLAPGKKRHASERLSRLHRRVGLVMAPLVRRSWNPKGQTPVVEQRTRHHQKVSAIAALYVPPTREVQLYFRLHRHSNLNAIAIRGFLQQLNRQLDVPWSLIWNRLQAHRAGIVQGFLAS